MTSLLRSKSDTKAPGTKEQNSKRVALVSGSLVFDTLFELTSPIREQILIKDGRLGKQNLMFSAHDKEVYFGGTAGNIVYGLSLLGEKPLLASVVGRDFGEYAEHLKNLGVVPRIYSDEQAYTATFYGMGDPRSEQIGIFQGNAYHKHVANLSLSRLLKESDWKRISVGIFAAGNAESITKQLKEFKKSAPEDALAIFDPGQMLMIDFTKESITDALKHSHILVVNDVEFTHLKRKFGFTLDRIFAAGARHVIVTKGEDGSMLYEEDKEIAVKPIKVKKVIDPTGAGDAFRAGLIHGILQGKSLPDAMRDGTRLGAACVQSNGGQTYRI